MMVVRWFVAATLTWVLALAGCSTAGHREPTDELATTPALHLERFRNEQKLIPGVQTIVLDNPYGELHVRQTQAAAIAIEGVEQRIGRTPRIARIDWFHEGVEQGVRVRYDGIAPDTPIDPRQGRVELYAFVPPGLQVQLRTDYGAIVVRRIDNEVSARSRTGAITVAARGAMDLVSASGEIRAWAMQAQWRRPVTLRTNGDIIADVPVFAPLDLAVSAADGIRADFDLDQLQQDASGRWRALLRTGTGRDRMRIDSLGGAVLLQALRAPIP